MSSFIPVKSNDRLQSTGKLERNFSDEEEIVHSSGDRNPSEYQVCGGQQLQNVRPPHFSPKILGADEGKGWAVSDAEMKVTAAPSPN